MLLATFNGKEHLRHRAVSLRQHGFLVDDICVKNDFYVFFLMPFRSKICSLFIQRYVSTKLEVFTAFLFRESRRHGVDGQTDKHTEGCNS